MNGAARARGACLFLHIYTRACDACAESMPDFWKLVHTRAAVNVGVSLPTVFFIPISLYVYIYTSSQRHDDVVRARMSFRVSLSAFLLSKLRRYASEREERMDRLFSYVSMTREALCALSVSERERGLDGCT